MCNFVCNYNEHAFELYTHIIHRLSAREERESRSRLQISVVSLLFEVDVVVSVVELVVDVVDEVDVSVDVLVEVEVSKGLGVSTRCGRSCVHAAF